MKTTAIVLALVWIGVIATPAQPADTSATWHYVNAITNLTGGSNVAPPGTVAPEEEVILEPPIVYATNGPVAIDLGMEATQIVTAEIRLLADGAVADYGLQKVYFPADITEAPLTIITPDGRKLACRATLLALHDRASGQTLVLGEVRKSIGELVDGNTVVYSDAFDTISAGIRYRYTPYSLEQDILLYDQIQLPAAFQSTNVQLEVWTEWIASPPDTKETQTIDLRPLAATGAQAGVVATDDTIQFGASRIAEGYAFGMQSEGDKIPVAKTFTRIAGSFTRIGDSEWLIESVDYTALKPSLDKLPKSQASIAPDRLQSDRNQLVRSLLARSEPKASGQPRRMAKASTPIKDSVVLDFVIVSGVPVPAGAVSWWPGGGNAIDAIGTNNGTLQGNVGYTVGKVGQGFNLDGNQDGVSVGNPTNLRLQDFTIEAWVRRASSSVVSYGSYGNGILFGYGYGGYGLYLDPTGKLALSKIGINGVVSSAAITNTSYHHVAVTKTGSTGVFYLDGVAYAVGAYNPGFTFATAAAIGFRADNLDNSFYGAIDEPAVYNRALSAEEVQSIYDAGAAGKINPHCVTPPANLLGWWPGDGNAYDLARTNTGTLVNNATYQAAVVSEGFSFNGTGGHVRVPDQASFHCTSGLTIEAWVNPTNVAAQNEIVDKWDAVVGYNQRSYAAALLPGGRFFLQLAPLGTTAGATYVATTNAVALNGWTHVAGTYDGSLIRVYLNGVLNAQGTYTSGIFPGTNDLAIGGVVGGAAYGSVILPFRGWIDEPSIYNRALSSTEITALYSAGSAGKCKMDTDGDGLTDLQEAFLGTNPNLIDTDGDGMDDGWEWDHFGSFGRGGSGDYDSDGVSDLDEYSAGTDPNTITFETHYPNLYVSNRTVTGSCAVATGVPAQIAVLVNSTNWPAAVWSPYNSNFTVTLPNQDSNHMVLVALRGRARDATVVWDETEITLDRVSPVLVVTNPATPTVSKPYLQLQGYANEALATLTYNLSNEFGLMTNELVAVVDQYFDTNRFDFTTNYFQGYDLALATNSNQITLRVTDLAGNVTTTNLSVALDYTAATSPGLEVLWPTNGTHLSGDSFYVRGNISDETASVVAESVAANGVTNVVSGLVERNGVFWVEGLPLAAGTNAVRLLATNAAGQVSSTNLSVVKSSVTLSITTTPEGESLYEPFGVVSGTVSYPNYTVTVNGQAATVDANGHWTAVEVPVLGRGTATFDAVAASSGGGGSASPVATSVAPELPAMIMIMKHFAKYTSHSRSSGHTGTEIRIKNYDAQFAPGADGQWRRSYQATVSSDITTDGSSSHNDYRWSHTNTVGTQHAVSGEVEVTVPMDGTFNNDVLIKYVPDKSLDHEEWTTGYNAPIRYLVTHFRAAGVKHRWVNSEGGFVEETLKARTDLKLFTGGKAGVGRRNLLCLNVWAEEYGRPVMHPWAYTYGTVVAADRIQLLGRSPGADGNLWLALPDNTDHSLNLRVPSAQHINAEVQPTKHKLRIVVNGVCPLAPDRVVPCAKQYWVGQQLNFTPVWIPAVAGVANKMVQWEFSGNYVNDSWQHFWMPPAPRETLI